MMMIAEKRTMLDESNLKRGELKALAKILMKLQESKNGGQGVSCVRAIATYLKKGDVSSAIATARNESDKLWSYPDIRRFIHDMIVPIGYWDTESGKIVG